MIESVDIPHSECLTCHYKLEATFSPFDGRKTPIKDDLSVCAKCGTVTKFDGNLNLVALTAIELLELKNKYPDTYKELRRAQSAINSMIKEN